MPEATAPEPAVPGPQDYPRIVEAQEALDKWLGMTSEIVPWSEDPANHVELQYKSPTGILLFTLSLQRHRGNWHFGSRSHALPTEVDQIRMLVEKIQPQKLEKPEFQKD